MPDKGDWQGYGEENVWTASAAEWPSASMMNSRGCSLVLFVLLSEIRC